MLCAWTKSVVTAAVLLLYSIAYVCDAGCSRPSPCVDYSVEGITPEGEDLVTSLDCDHDNTLSMTWNWTTSPDATCLIDRLQLRYTCYLLNMENSDRQERSTTYSQSGNNGTGSLVVEQEWIMNTTYTVQCEVGGFYEISADVPCRLLLPNKKLNATCSIPSVESSAVILPSTTAIQPTATRRDLSMAWATTRQPKFTPVASTSSAMEEGISISTFSIVVVLLIASFTLSHCIVCIFCYYFRTNLKGTQKRQICCCLQNRVEVPDVYYEPVLPLLHQPHITRATESQVATASTNETSSEQMTINSPVYQVIDNKNQIHQSDPRSGIDYLHTAISAYRTADTSTDPEIVSEHDEDYERNEMTASREVGTDMGFLSTLVNEIEDSDIMQRESQPSLHFTLTANSAYGTDVAIAPEILTEQNEAYERNEVTILYQ